MKTLPLTSYCSSLRSPTSVFSAEETAAIEARVRAKALVHMVGGFYAAAYCARMRRVRP